MKNKHDQQGYLASYNTYTPQNQVYNIKTHKTPKPPLLVKLRKRVRTRTTQAKLQESYNLDKLHSPPYLGWILGSSLVWIPTNLFFSLFFSSFSSLHKFLSFSHKYLKISLFLSISLSISLLLIFPHSTLINSN